MKEILGQQLDVAIRELGISATKTYEELTNSDYKHQVWEVKDKDFEILCNIDEDSWKSEWGWWRHSEGSNMDNSLSEFYINNQKITAWDGTSRIETNKEAEDEDDEYLFEREYSNLLEYFCDEMGASQPRNICALAVDLAKINNMTMSELFQVYQG